MSRIVRPQYPSYSDVSSKLEASVRLETRRLILRDMIREDLEPMQRWRPLTDPLSQTWNFQWQSRAELESWFDSRSHDPGHRLYSILLRNGQVIGRLSLRHIHPPESAVLGIGLGAQWIGQGYGTEALRAFARYYFDELGFRVLWLDVAATNSRAIRCYEKCGFVKTGSRYQSVGSRGSLSFLNKPEYAHLRPFLKQRFGQYLVLFYDMKLERSNLILEDEELEFSSSSC